MKKILSICLILLSSSTMASTASAQGGPMPNGTMDQFDVAQNATGYWNGYHGDPGPRNGFRQGPDGWWYPLAAFAAGAIVGGAVAADDVPPPPPPGYEPPPRAYRPPPAYRAQAFPPEHYAWCGKRYRSYFPSDNSYVPRVGVRAQCVSPYN